MRQLALILFQPKRIAEAIKCKPRWVAQVLILAGLSVIISVLTHPFVVETALHHLPSSASDADKAALTRMFDDELGVRLAFLPIRLLLGWTTFALLLFYVCRTWRSPEAVRFSQLFSLVVSAESITILAQLTSFVGMQFITSELSFGFVNPPSTLMIVGAPIDFITASFLNSINIFAVWNAVILIVGVRILYGFSTWKALVTIIVGWGVLTVSNLAVLALLRDTLRLRI